MDITTASYCIAAPRGDHWWTLPQSVTVLQPTVHYPMIVTSNILVMEEKNSPHPPPRPSRCSFGDLYRVSADIYYRSTVGTLPVLGGYSREVLGGP